MGHVSCCWLLSLLAIIPLLIKIVQGSSIPETDEKKGVKTAVFLSPKFELEPGSVCEKYYYDIDFPRGHMAIKDFSAEVVDEAGQSVPLLETYLHHWVVVRYYQSKDTTKNPEYDLKLGFQQKPDYILAANSGVCNHGLVQYFGLGSETRRTDEQVPDPYGIEVGNPSEIPQGYEEKWMLNVHAIDTRGAEDRLGCTECRCDLYNVTEDKHGRALDPNYIGGLKCCYDETKCRVQEGFQSWKRGLYLKYTVKYLEWHASSIVPVKIYIFDVTDKGKTSDDNTTALLRSSRHDCQIEYQVEPCPSALPNDECTDTKRVSVLFPDDGDLIYGAGHQHTGGIGSTLYGEDGRVLCSSIPIYGKGKEPGNEAGYIVGMSTCYPQPGSIKISNGEMLTLVSNYSSSRPHTGVMGLFYILVANSYSSPNHLSSTPAPIGIHKRLLTPDFILGSALFGVLALVVAAVVWQRRNQNADKYEPILA